MQEGHVRTFICDTDKSKFRYTRRNLYVFHEVALQSLSSEAIGKGYVKRGTMETI